MIILEKLNECVLRVLGEPSEEADVKKYFTFKVPGYQFMEKYKKGIWNGDMSLYDIRTKLLPLGLYNRLVEFLEETNTPYTIKENQSYSIDDKDTITLDELQSWIDELDINLPQGGTVRDYQLDAILKALNDKKRLLKSPTSSGKSLIIYCIIRWILDKNPHAKIILMVPTIQLVNQMFSDFQEYSEHNGFDVGKYAQKLFTGQPKELTKNILITTWQSLKNIANNPVVGNKVLAQYNMIIGDEAHTNKANECQNILMKCKNASYRIGTTGSLDNKKMHLLQLEGMLGPLYVVTTTKELIDTGQVSKLDLRCLILKYPEAVSKQIKELSYDEEIDYLVSNEARNTFICKLAMACEGTTLILTKLKDRHAVPLYENLLNISKKPIYYVSGTISPEERERIRKIANIEECIIVATDKTMSTGVNIPNLRNVIFGMPSKDIIKITQSIGRGLRLHKDKKKMMLIDIIDDMRYKKSTNFAYDHAIERLELYRKEQFDFSLTELPFTP